MPAVALTRGGVLVALKYDFGAGCRWPREWTISVRRPTPYRGPIFGLFDPLLDLRPTHVEGLAPELVFGPYRENQAEFTYEVEHEWDVAALLPCAWTLRPGGRRATCDLMWVGSP
jgi:hypothetical protein